MKKKLLMFVMTMVLCFALAACGGGGDKEKDDGIDPNATVTKEQYDKLSNDDAKWDMTPEDMEKYFGVKYVEDEESTKDWGDGYLVVDFPGPDEKSYIHILFKDDGSGKYTPSSINPNGQFLDM